MSFVHGSEPEPRLHFRVYCELRHGETLDSACHPRDSTLFDFLECLQYRIEIALDEKLPAKSLAHRSKTEELKWIRQVRSGC